MDFQLLQPDQITNGLAGNFAGQPQTVYFGYLPPYAPYYWNGSILVAFGSGGGGGGGSGDVVGAAASVDNELPLYSGTGGKLLKRSNGLTGIVKVTSGAASMAVAGTDFVTPAGLASAVSAAIAAVVAGSPTTLDTLDELAAALGDDPNFATTLTTLIGTKANSSNPVFTGTVTSPGAQITTASAMAALVIDTTKALNTKSVNAATTFTFSGTPTADSWFGLQLTNSGGTERVITIPSSFSIAKQAAITSFTLPANGYCELVWHYTGSGYMLSGDPLTTAEQRTAIAAASTAQTTSFSWIVTVPADGPLSFAVGFGITVTNLTAYTASGTCTLQVTNAGVSTTGGLLNVTTTQASNAITAGNVLAAGAKLGVTVSASDGGVENLSITITGTRTLA